MTGLLTGSLSGSQFQVLTSLLIVALVYIGGVARISGAVIAGLVFVPNGLGATLLDQWLGVGKYATLVGGVGLIITLILAPDGLSDRLEHAMRGVRKRLWVGPRPAAGDDRAILDEATPTVGARS